MKFAYYPGCNIATEAYSYEQSARKTLERLGVELLDMRGYSCCGITVRSINPFAFLYLAGRNIALAERENLPLLTFCTGCRMSLQECKHVLDNNDELKRKINEILATEGIEYKGTGRIIHILELLHDIVGVEKIKAEVKKPINGMRVAPHYGCHALRPGKIAPQDDPENPQKLDNLIRVIGGTAPPHPEKLDCCGAPLLLKDADAAYTLAGQKIKALQEHGFDAIVTICPSCQKMLDTQDIAGRVIGAELSLPVLYYTQLLGLAMDMDPDELGLGANSSPVRKIIERIKGNGNSD